MGEPPKPLTDLSIPESFAALSPEDALRVLAGQQHRQTILLHNIQAQASWQSKAIADLADSLDFIENDIRSQKSNWMRLRRQVNIAFWIYIGLPLLALVVALLLLFFLLSLPPLT